ncbi:C4-dicarboxylate TRAP transporter substrate-binding protein [Petralouisia muris]|nr:C4-dicarboxylate TRAP transporter substrate-binding protein [Petralouisia muris]
MEKRKILSIGGTFLAAALVAVLLVNVRKTMSANSDGIILQIGFENSISEPIGQALVKWQQLVEEQGDGSIRLELYPDSQLGSKNELIDGMTFGENYITLADGAFYADYGVKDFGIVFGPFLFDNWEQCWDLIESDWYQGQCEELEGRGLKIVTSNWKYGERHTLTKQKVETVEDLKGLKIRVPGNQLQSIGFDVLGATSTGMDLGDVYQALQTGAIDGAENPLATLYGRKLHEVAKYLIMDAHVLNFTTWVMSNEVFEGLDKEQQELLISTAKEAGIYNNELVEESNDEYLQMMMDEGMEVVEPSQEVMDGFKKKAEAFYSQGDVFGWSEGLYEKVKAEIGK